MSSITNDNSFLEVILSGKLYRTIIVRGTLPYFINIRQSGFALYSSLDEVVHVTAAPFVTELE
jgi:hypothetical protein